MPNSTWSRRELMSIAAGLGLSIALPGLDARAARKRGTDRPKSLVTLWLAGGPSQLETWDPHPGTRIGGPTRAISTAVPGLKIADSFPRLAEQMPYLSVIRSLVSKEGDHDRAMYLARTGYRIDPTVTHPALGAIVALESPNPDLDLPAVIAMGYSNGRFRGGYLGSQYDAFQIRDPGSHGERMDEAAPEGQRRRETRLDVVSRAVRTGRTAAVDRTMHRQSIEAALRMMSSEQLQALDLNNEPEAIRAGYGDTHFGRSCLLARRLIEQGVRAIDVTLQNFDTHSNNFAAHKEKAAELDPAFAALIKDLVERDLWQSTVVLCIGEFGRTPRINGSDGRDHWPSGFACLVGGGGLQGGVVVGATDPTGERKEPEDPVQIADLYATILKALGIDYAHQVETPIGRPMRYSAGSPIDRLLG